MHYSRRECARIYKCGESWWVYTWELTRVYPRFLRTRVRNSVQVCVMVDESMWQSELVNSRALVWSRCTPALKHCSLVFLTFEPGFTIFNFPYHISLKTNHFQIPIPNQSRSRLSFAVTVTYFSVAYFLIACCLSNKIKAICNSEHTRGSI